MKKLLLSAVMLSTFIVSGAQVLTVKSVERVNTPERLIVSEAVISGDGTYVVAGDVSSSALTGIDLATGKTRVVSDNGSMLDLKLSKDGTKVVYRQRTLKNKLGHTGLKATDLKTGKTVEVAKPSRNLNGFELTEAGVVTAAVTEGTKSMSKVKSLTGAKSGQTPVVGINRGHLVVNVADRQTILDPQGRGSYLWPSISPDGTKIVYYKSQKGCYVCNLDGSNPIYLGYVHAPKWYGNDVVIGMQDYDDGTNVTASSVVAVDMSGTIQKLTDESVIAMYPGGAPEVGKIVFNDNMGNLYLITVE